jgi:hypothetical protein
MTVIAGYDQAITKLGILFGLTGILLAYVTWIRPQRQLTKLPYQSQKQSIPLFSSLAALKFSITS